MSRMFIATLTFAVSLLIFAGGMGAATASGVAPAAAPVSVRPCQMLRMLPGYVYRYQGATITEPTGAVRYGEMLADGVHGAAMQASCRRQVQAQIASNGAPAPTLRVYRELRLG